MSPDHREAKQYDDAWAIIYDSCNRRFRQLSGCHCEHAPHCIHEIGDFVESAVINLDKCFEDNRVINFPPAYLSRVCRNIWLRGQDDIRWREAHEVEYDEEPGDGDSLCPNWSQAISRAIIERADNLPSADEVKSVILRSLRSKRLTLTEVKLFLHFYRDRKKLKDLATFYRMNTTKISRLKTQVIFCLRDEFHVCSN